MLNADRRLDAIDRRILRALRRDGRMSNTLLADEVGLSPSPCWQRTRRLENEGYIKGYEAIIDHEMLGFGETVIIEITLERHDEGMMAKFGQAMAEMPEVIEAYLTTGEYDYFIKVAVNGTKGYEEFLRNKLYRIPGIRHSRSSFALRCIKQGGAPIPD